MSTKNDTAIFVHVAQAEGELRQEFLANLARIRKVPVESLVEAFESFQKNNAEALEKARKKAEKDATKARREALVKEGASLALDSEGLPDFIGRVKAEGGVVTLNEDLTIAVVVELPKARAPGAGKTPAWKPTDFRDSEGDRVCGPLTTWVKENLSDKDQKEAGAFRPNGKMRTGEKLANAMVKAGILTRDNATAEEIQAAKEAHEASKGS